MVKLERSAADFLPAKLTLPALRAASKGCRGCELYKRGTETVFGRGPLRAQLFFIGEQPGDHEDQAGEAFVGPAGKMLDKALAEVGIDRSAAYVTNAVKHFKWEPRGKRRLHAKPTAREVAACKPWLESEFKVVQPRLVVLLGATAAQALLGASFRVTVSRGKILNDDRYRFPLLATVHPSSLLRAPDEKARAEAWEGFVRDLKVAAGFISGAA
ncbi:MAG TPA: UdgX family uracil-DNA binding protein [Planctomycetota bacterium]|nr:UdgX family uracil-DNA binding protein [Planctomycetota bacterium]